MRCPWLPRDRLRRLGVAQRRQKARRCCRPDGHDARRRRRAADAVFEALEALRADAARLHRRPQAQPPPPPACACVHALCPRLYCRAKPHPLQSRAS
eukprot:6031232-Pleurochrysis_carterae.AAC.4